MPHGCKPVGWCQKAPHRSTIAESYPSPSFQHAFSLCYPVLSAICASLHPLHMAVALPTSQSSTAAERQVWHPKAEKRLGRLPGKLLFPHRTIRRLAAWPGELSQAAPAAWEISECVQGRGMRRIKKKMCLKMSWLALIHPYLQN